MENVLEEYKTLIKGEITSTSNDLFLKSVEIYRKYLLREITKLYAKEKNEINFNEWAYPYSFLNTEERNMYNGLRLVIELWLSHNVYWSGMKYYSPIFIAKFAISLNFVKEYKDSGKDKVEFAYNKLIRHFHLMGFANEKDMLRRAEEYTVEFGESAAWGIISELLENKKSKINRYKIYLLMIFAEMDRGCNWITPNIRTEILESES